MTQSTARTRRGATLLEIAVLVGIFVVLAAAAAPRFAAAEESALRDGLRIQVDQLNRSIEMFRADHDDAPPMLGGASDFGWTALVATQYLIEAPVNALLKTATVVQSDESPPILDPDATTVKARVGWFFHGIQSRVVANGFDHLSGAFFDEPGYDPQAFAW